MSFWKNRPFRGPVDILRGLLERRKNKNDISGRDRHVTAEEANPAAGKRPFYRRFTYLGGFYLLAVAALVLIVLLRLGMLPLPGSRGLDFAGESMAEKEQGSGIFPCEENDCQDPVAEGNRLPMILSAPEGENPLPVYETPGPGTDDPHDEAVGDGDFVSIPPPALPLPRWHLHEAYGDYVREALPSGGHLHRRSRGVFLEGVPGAPVSALWDGVVSTVGEKGFPCGSYVVLEHEGSYSTVYGNLRQIWVREGDEINRGENIGLLPNAPAARESGQPAGTLPFHTVIGSGEECSPVYSPFHNGNPLFYLELRYANRCLDPFLFLEERN